MMMLAPQQQSHYLEVEEEPEEELKDCFVKKKTPS